MKRLIVLACLSAICFEATAAGVQSETADVNAVRVQMYTDSTGSIRVGSNWFTLDLNTEKGRLAFSTALVAQASNKKLKVQWNEDLPLEGGCDTGTTMHPLHSIILNK